MKKETGFILILIVFSIRIITPASSNEALSSLNQIGLPPQVIPFQSEEPEIPAVDKRIVGGVSTAAVECGSNPTDGCVISQNTTFNPGTYVLPNGTTIIADNIVLNCNGATLNGIEPQPFPIYVWQEAINADGKHNIVIKNCRIINYRIGIVMRDCNNNSSPGYGFCMYAQNNYFENLGEGLGVLGNNTLIEGNTFYNITPAAQNPIWGGGKNWTIKNNTLNLGFDDGVLLSNSCEINVTNNRFYNIPGFRATPQTKTYSNCSYLFSFTNNIVENSTRHGIDIIGSNVSGNLDVSIKNNQFINNDKGVIHIYWNNFSGEILIENNTFRNSNQGTIFINDHRGKIDILDNRFYNNNWYAVDNAGNSIAYGETDMRIKNNICIGVGVAAGFDHCFIMRAFQGPTSNTLFENNTASNSNVGIFVYNNFNSKNNIIKKNIISGNYVGISTEYSNGAEIITGNNILNNMFGLGILGSTTSKAFLNNIHLNNYNAFSDLPREVSYIQHGNYWGRTNPPCFVAGVDSNRLDVIDSYPYCNPQNLTSTVTKLNPNSWNIVSFNINPENTATQTVLKSLEENNIPQYSIVQALLNGNADQYVPGSPFNDLNNMVPWNGYWIKINDSNPNNLVVIGNEITICHQLNLNPGTHWIGYWQENPEATSGALSSVAGNYDYIRTFENGAWKTYDPDLIPFSDLTEMKPGNGYLIKMLNSDTLDYCL